MSKRELAKTREKQRRIAVYTQGDRSLFVPTGELWEIHYAAAACRFWDGKEWSIRELRDEIEKRLGRKIPQWLFGGIPLRKYPWFFDWLLCGKNAPDHVQIATASEVRWARRAWNYTAHLRKAGSTWDTYRQCWLIRGLIPDLPWLKWLYGWAPPIGHYVTSEAIWKVRRERSEERIRWAAHVSKRTLSLWKKDSILASALGDAMIAAGKGGHVGGLTSSQSWSQVKRRVQDAIWRYAKAATLTACCKRAGVDRTYIDGQLAIASRLGVEKNLENHLAVDNRGKQALKAGILFSGFFVASPKMLKFRSAAISARKGQKLSKLENHPAFDVWFEDWVIPRKMKGRRFELPKPSANGHGVPAENQSIKPQVKAAEGPQTPPVNKGGRPPSDEISARNRACYEARVSSEPLLTTKSRLNQNAGKTVIRRSKDVTLFAKRFATANGKPWPIPRSSFVGS